MLAGAMLTLVAGLKGGVDPAFDAALAQEPPAQALPAPDAARDRPARELPAAEAARRERRNQWSVGIAGGALGDPGLAFAAEIARVLDDGDDLHVLPIATAGPARNLDDLLALESVDAAVTQSDVPAYLGRDPGDDGLRYLVRLPVADLHVIAAAAVTSLQDLRGRTVDFGIGDGAADVTGTVVLQRLGIAVEEVSHLDDRTAIDRLRSGAIAAVVRVAARRWGSDAALAAIPADAGLHLVAVPVSADLADLYVADDLHAADYPALIGAGAVTATIAVPRLLAVVSWPRGSDRYRRVQRFTEALFNKFGQLRVPAAPGWRDLSLAATVPGWSRFGVAEDLVREFRDAGAFGEPVTSAFPAFLKERHAEGIDPAADPQALYEEFVQWQSSRGIDPGSR